MSKQRLDRLLVTRGLAETRQKARGFIMAGQVFVNYGRIDKPGKEVEENAIIELRVEGLPYVSRGGLKLGGAIAAFNLSVTDAICLDVGASTGGFTQCLLKQGAARVFALDVGRGQLHWKLRSDPRVVIMEGINARYVKPSDFSTQFDLVTIDVSFISLRKILPALIPLLNPHGMILALVKPQFEVGKGKVGKGGVVRHPAQHQQVLGQIQAFAEQMLQLFVKGLIESPVPGAEGNKEFFLLLTKDPEAPRHEIRPIADGS
ncbi:MAG: TlyA family RNA methyltransferase [Acidobacteria bacterium]|nr:TlyA family RNA methyltransferase [Acidobacteriota bacterium]